MSVLTIPANHVPTDAAPDATGLPVESYVPRCACGWAGPRTLCHTTASTNERLHAERCDTETQGALW